eukprot:3646172-Lingulodinium_polyedra.AAC.1
MSNIAPCGAASRTRRRGAAPSRKSCQTSEAIFWRGQPPPASAQCAQVLCAAAASSARMPAKKLPTSASGRRVARRRSSR